MTHFDHRGLVSNQASHQYIQGNAYVYPSYRPPTTDATPNYDLGPRLGTAPEINEEDFVGREAELTQLHNWLAPQPKHQNVVALYGLGGVGKTQLSIQFVKKFGDTYSAVFWLNAKDENTLKIGMADLGMNVIEDGTGRSVNDSHEEEQMVQRARQWLSHADNDKWLVIYDNYNGPSLPGIPSSAGYDVRNFFPNREHGSILITTRSPRILFARQLRLRHLEDVNEGLKILATRSGREISGDTNAVTLAQRLDGLPLALATAGMYLRQTAATFGEYLQLYDKYWSELRECSDELLDYKDRTLYTTWNLSLINIQNEDAAAGQLLRLTAYLDNQDLWYELFQAGAQDQPLWWSEVVKSRTRFDQAMSILHDHSLVEVRAGIYTLHSCVHHWVLESLNREIDNELSRLAIRCVAQSVKWNTESEYWAINRRVSQHGRRFQNARLQTSMNWNDMEPRDLYCLAYLYRQSDMTAAAEKMYILALRGYEKVWGAEYTSTLDTVNNLGALYADQGKLVEAEAMYMRALQGYKKVLGAEHTSTFNTINNLGIIYANQGKMAEAEAMYIRALQGYEKAWGAEHTPTLCTVNNLGALYADQGKLVEAEAMYMRALQGYEKVLEPEHTSIFNTVNNLGLLYANQGKMTEAEAMYVRALQGYEKTWGAEHTSTLGTASNLGMLYANQGKLAEAEAMYMQALQGYEKAWGAEHPSTLGIFNNLGLLYAKQGKVAVAEEMCVRALQGYEKVWGAEHTSTLDTINNLGNLFTAQSKMVEAEEMYLRALRGFEKALGPEHTSTLNTVNNLGLLYVNQGKMAEAEEMHIRALRGFEKAFGPEHTSTLNTVNNLGLLYANQGKMTEAEEMYVRALLGKEKAWGVEHMSTLDTVYNLGLLYAKQGKRAEAEEMYLRALRGTEKALGAEHTSTLDIANNLGNLFADQGKMVEAEEMYLSALQMAAALGKEELVQQLVGERINMNFAGKRCTNALQVAAKNGHDAVVRILLENGVDVNTELGHHVSALQAASAGGHEAIVRILLENGADINAELGSYGSALQAASAGGHEAVVRMLLANGANVNTEPGRHGSALRAASAGGHETIVRLLLDNGADPKGENGQGTSLLDVAVAGDHQGVIRLLIDKGMLVSSNSKPRPSKGDPVTSSSSSTSSTSSTSSNLSLPTSSATSRGYEPLSDVFTILIVDVLLEPELKDLWEKMLRNTEELLFMRIFKREIRTFCSALGTENPTDIQKDSIRILRRYRAYFAFRVYQLLRPSTTWDGSQLEDLMDQVPDVESRVERYLQEARRVVQPRLDAAAVGLTGNIALGGTVTSVINDSEDNARDKSQGQKFSDTGIEDDIGQDALEYADDESSASDTSDDEPKSHTESLTRDTISWLINSISFHNFRYNICRYIYSCLSYVQEVLQLALRISELCSATFHIEWDLLRYTESELEEGQMLSTVLTVSGDIVDAEASTCLDYCGRTWPTTGGFVTQALEKAIRNGQHRTTVSFQLLAGNIVNAKENATVLVSGPKEHVVSVAQQLAWLSTVFRVPQDGKLACSEFIIHKTRDPGVFKLKLLKLREIKATRKSCWHPLFHNGVLAYRFPFRPRGEEVGVELPFDVMTYLAGTIGPVEYREGIVLKGYSTIIFPKSPPPQVANADRESVQWHLLYDRSPAPATLTSLAEEEGRTLWQLTDLRFLERRRNFLGCYKKIDIHLGTKGTAYDRIDFSQANPSRRRPEFSSFSFGLALPKFGGLSGMINCTIPKRLSLTREEDSYEQILSYGSTMPLILYDTSDRRAWMVPALSAILHMIHIWAAVQKQQFPLLCVPHLPYAEAAWDIGRAAQEVIYKNSKLQLYVSKDDDKPYLLKDLVKKYWLQLEKVIEAEKDRKFSVGHLIGWELMELVTGDPSSLAKETSTTEIRGNWNAIANDPNMVVLFCRGLGDVIVPNTEVQKLCRIWKSVPTERDYLTASVECILQWSKRFSGPGQCSKLGHAIFWRPSDEDELFTDCSHDDHLSCQRVQELKSKCNYSRSTSSLEQQGAVVFGKQHKKLQKQSIQSC